ncbi:hypothetical protein B0H11DRAFT_2368091 [Mycena galericulata]|nr:hypothetical protein B0H11DRAFT_2368091 [Mycena galericulata]
MCAFQHRSEWESCAKMFGGLNEKTVCLGNSGNHIVRKSWFMHWKVVGKKSDEKIGSEVIPYTAIPDVQVVARSSSGLIHGNGGGIGRTGGGIGRDRAGSARGGNSGGKVMGGGCETARSRGSSSSGPGTAGIGGGGSCAGQRDQAAGRESAEKEGIFVVPAVRVPGQRREALEWEKAGEQWNRGHRGWSRPRAAAAGGKREAGSDSRVAATGSGAGRETTARRREPHGVGACGGSSAAGASVLVAGKRERKAEYPVANTCKHPPNPVTDAAPPHGPSDRRGGVFDGRAAHLMEGPAPLASSVSLEGRVMDHIG